MQDKYIALYRKLVTQLCIYVSAIRILAKGYLPILVVTPSKLREILNEVKIAMWMTNPDYDLVIDSLHLYYNTQLVTFGIDKDRNLIIQFPVHTAASDTESIRNSANSHNRPKYTSAILHTLQVKKPNCTKF